MYDWLMNATMQLIINALISRQYVPALSNSESCLCLMNVREGYELHAVLCTTLDRSMIDSDYLEPGRPNQVDDNSNKTCKL